MAEQRKRDDPMAGLLARTLCQGLDASAGNCPDAEMLANYFDRMLTGEEAARLELHFASCDRCQAQLATLARMGSAGAAAPRPQTAATRWFDWRWLAPAAAALGAVALWVVIRGPQSPPITATGEPVLTAEKRTPPESSPESAAAPPSSAPAAGEQATAPTGFAVEGASSRATRKVAEPLLADKLAKADSAGGMAAPKTEPSPARLASEPAAAPAEESAALAREVAAVPKVEAKEAEAQAAPVQKADLARDEAARPAEQFAVRQDREANDSALLKRQKAPAAAGALSTEATPPDSKFGEGRANTATIIDMTHVTQAVVAAPNGSAYWRITPGGLIERSTDSGKTWHRQASPVQAHLLAGSAPAANVCWVVGKAGVVLRTTDGQTWHQLGSPTALDIVAVDAKDADTATVTTADGKRYSTTDAGRTWRSL